MMSRILLGALPGEEVLGNLHVILVADEEGEALMDVSRENVKDVLITGAPLGGLRGGKGMGGILVLLPAQRQS